MNSTAKATKKAASANESEKHDAYAALRVRDFRLFLSGHLLSVLGVQMQTTAVGWQAADRFDRRKTLMSATTLAVIAAFGLVAVGMWAGANVPLIYVCLFLSGLARAFQGPARSALMPQLIPYQIFSNAVSWNVSGFELSSMLGPALAGWLIYLFGGVTPVYLFAGLGSAIYFVMLATLAKRSYAAESRASQTNLRTLVAGFKYVWNKKLLFGAMSLDMFAVLFGGAVALLPVYAKDILSVGPAGFGALQAAPSLGAITMALLTTHLPPLTKAGRTLLWAVAGFGLATIVFGLSRNFWLSLAMLFLTGAFDNISVVVRHTLATILTPDGMRGRVSAVSGGVGALVVVATVALSSPQLRRFGRLDSHTQNSETE